MELILLFYFNLNFDICIECIRSFIIHSKWIIYPNYGTHREISLKSDINVRLKWSNDMMFSKCMQNWSQWTWFKICFEFIFFSCTVCTTYTRHIQVTKNHKQLVKFNMFHRIVRKKRETSPQFEEQWLRHCRDSWFGLLNKQ